MSTIRSKYNVLSYFTLFLSLKNHGTNDEAERMFEIGASTMEIPLEEKMKYEQGDDGCSFGLVSKCSAEVALIRKLVDIKKQAQTS